MTVLNLKNDNEDCNSGLVSFQIDTVYLDAIYEYDDISDAQDDYTLYLALEKLYDDGAYFYETGIADSFGQLNDYYEFPEVEKESTCQ